MVRLPNGRDNTCLRHTYERCSSMRNPCDIASDSDAAWFRRNPYRKLRLRKQIPGEFDMVLSDGPSMSGEILPDGYTGSKEDFVHRVRSRIDAALIFGGHTLVHQFSPGFRGRRPVKAGSLSRSQLRRLSDADIYGMYLEKKRRH